MNVLDQLESLVSTKLSEIKTVFSLIKLEARLAGLSVYPLLLNICMLFVVLLSAWSVTMVLLGYCLLLAFNNFLLAITTVLLLNLGFLLGLLKYLMFNLKNMSFEKTRAYFSNDESTEYDKLEKTVDSANRTVGTVDKMPANQGDRE